MMEITKAAQPKVLIVGGGIVGICTAYFLIERGVQNVCLVEQSKNGIAQSSSGKAGGFLAKGWGDRATRGLHEEGFRLHEELASKLGVSSFRYLKTYQVGQRKRGRKPSASGECSFLNPDNTTAGLMDDATAQVTPFEFCSKVFEAATMKGLSFVNGETLEADLIVVAMGAWTVALENWVPGYRLPMVGIASSSMIIPPKEGRQVSATACFCEEDDQGCHIEIYPRPDDSAYVCGFGGSPHLVKDQILQLEAETVLPNKARLPDVKKSLQSLTTDLYPPENEEGSLIIQCCLRPCSADSNPVIGRIPNSNIIVGSGGNCWGILWGPRMGQLISELILDDNTTSPIKQFSPTRF